jgi:hypothetical protein
MALGSRSLSDFARLTVRRAIGGDGLPPDALEARVRELKGRTAEIDRELDQLMRLMRGGAPLED